MKVLVRNEDNISIYLINDAATVDFVNNQIHITGDAVMGDVVVGDRSSDDTTLYEDVTDAPDDWFGWKYIYENSQWTLNPDFVEDVVPE
jgi:hypothetical protein